MKKFLTIILVIALVAGGGILYYKKKHNFNGKWYIEVIYTEVNLRSKPDVFSNIVSSVKKGEKYLVEDINLEDNRFIWYKIKNGWVANPRVAHNYLNDYNNPNDIYSPTLKYNVSTYHAKDINSINYDHLECWDDKSYTLSHQVYIDKNNETGEIKYWIKYTITDTAGRTASKTQRITFDTNPTSNLPDISTAK